MDVQGSRSLGEAVVATTLDRLQALREVVAGTELTNEQLRELVDVLCTLLSDVLTLGVGDVQGWP